MLRMTMMRMRMMVRMVRMRMTTTIQISSTPGGLPDLRTFYRGCFTNYVAESHSIMV